LAKKKPSGLKRASNYLIYGAPRDKVNEPKQGLFYCKNSELKPLIVERIAKYKESNGRNLDYAELAKLHLKQEMTPKEISKLLNRSIHSIHYALRKIRNEVNNEDIN
jgi:hypothetical protein